MVKRIAFADPPYLGCCGLYGHHHPDGKCWDDATTHFNLIARLKSEFDGWILCAHVPSIPSYASYMADAIHGGEVRVCSWVKGFAAYKRNVPVAYAWEPVYVKAARKPVVSKRDVSRDWIECSITLRKGLTGAKPEKVCLWSFERVGARPEDELIDLFPGTGGVGRAWQKWCGLFTLPAEIAS